MIVRVGEGYRDIASDLIKSFNAPLSREDFARCWAELMALCLPRKEAAEDTAMQAVSFARRCEKYPGQIVRDALMAWPERSRYMPTWNELQSLIHDFNVRYVVNTGDRKPTEPLRERENSPEERRRMAGKFKKLGDQLVEQIPEAASSNVQPSRLRPGELEVMKAERLAWQEKQRDRAGVREC